MNMLTRVLMLAVSSAILLVCGCPSDDPPDDPSPRPNGGLSDVTVAASDVNMTIFDHVLVDGDVIDLIVNGEYVLQDYELEEPPGITVNVRLTQQENTVVVHADNTGDVPPNTACLEISDVVRGDPVQIWTIDQNHDASMTISVPQALLH